MSSVAPVSHSALVQISIGETTEAEITRLLGTPHTTFDEIGVTDQLDALFLYKANRYLRNLDDKHVGVLYRFTGDTGKSVRGIAVLVNSGGTNIAFKTDQLLLLINRETRVVDDIGYRREMLRR